MLRELKWFTREQRRNQASLTLLHKMSEFQKKVMYLKEYFLQKY